MDGETLLLSEDLQKSHFIIVFHFLPVVCGFTEFYYSAMLCTAWTMLLQDVCLSLSHVGILSKRLNFFHLWVVTPL